MSKKEGRYYVEYLGWKESRGLFGREFTEPVVRELLARRRLNNVLPKMTIKLNQTEVQISQEVAKKPSSKPEKSRYPSIPTKDATFVIQSFYPDSDIVACIFLGYNPYTKCAVHVHVYRFDSDATAETFVKHLSSIIEQPEFKERILGIETDLAQLGHVTLRRSQSERASSAALRHSTGSDGFSHGTPSPHSSASLSPKYPTAEESLKQRPDIVIIRQKKPSAQDSTKRHLFTSLQEELEYKLKVDNVPVLLPPKDYDTIVRRHGKVEIRDDVVNSSRGIIGPNSIFSDDEPTTSAQQHGNKDRESTRNFGDGDIGTANGTNGQMARKAAYTRQKSEEHSRLVRSSSDTNARLTNDGYLLHREASFTKSEISNNSDDFFSDGLYKGYKPYVIKKSKSKENGAARAEELITPMAMWSPYFSYNQSAVTALPTHREESDPLNRTAPASVFYSQPYSASGHNFIDNPGHRVKRSHSEKQKLKKRK